MSLRKSDYSRFYNDYDVIIVGAGPAGFMAAYMIVEYRQNLRVVIIDKGPKVEDRICLVKSGSKCVGCKPCRIISGPGGAGVFSDGKMFFEEAGGYLEEEGDKLENAALINWVRTSFNKLFSPEELPGKQLNPVESEAKKLEDELKSLGFECKTNRPFHIGTENCFEFVKRMMAYLEVRNVEFKLNTNVESIEVDKGYYKINIRHNQDKVCFRAPYLVLAVGKGGSEWLAEQMRSLGVQPVKDPAPYIGIRIETRREFLKRLLVLGGDPKISYKIRREGTTDRVKTHCFADGGYVIQINYDNGITLVDGYSYVDERFKSPNSSVNILVNTTDEKGIPSEAWHHLLKGFTYFGKRGFPILQRLEDFYNQVSSSEEKIKNNKVKPTLKSYEFGDINEVFSHRIIEDIKEFIDNLNRIVPGINDKDNLIYAPAAEWYIPRWIPKPAIFHRMQPKRNGEIIKGLFIIGDGAGLSQGIVMAATTGLVASWAIANEMYKS